MRAFLRDTVQLVTLAQRPWASHTTSWGLRKAHLENKSKYSKALLQRLKGLNGTMYIS